MTLNAGNARNEYTSGAGQTVFSYTFKIYESTDLDVYVTPAGQECSDSDLTTSYTVSGVGNESGGTITLNTPASNGDLVTIVSDIPTSRTTDYQNNGDFRPDTVNNDFDRAYSLIKQADDASRRSLQFSPCVQNVSSLSLPGPVSGNLLRWKDDLSGLENVPYPTNLLNSSFEDIDIVDGQTDYTALVIGVSGARIELAKAAGDSDGTLLVAGTDYTVTSDTTFTLSRSYPNGVLRLSNFVEVETSGGGSSETITTAQLITSTVYAAQAPGFFIETSGYSSLGVGAAKWQKTGVTGLTPSQSPAQTGDGSLNDANGEQWKIAEPFVTAAMFGDIYSNATTAVDVVHSAMEAVSDATTPAVRLFVSDEPFSAASRITVPEGIEVDFGGGLITVQSNDRVVVVQDGCRAFNLNADGSVQTGTPELSVVTVKSNVFIDRIAVNGGYSGVSLSESVNSTVRNVITTNNQSRGVALDPFATGCEVTNVICDNNGNAGILLGHGTNNCIVDKFWITQTNNASLWVSQGCYDNKIMNGYISNPILTTSVGINVTSNCQRNLFENIDVQGYDRVIQFIGYPIDGIYPSIPNGHTSNNKAVNLTGTGNNSGAGYAFHFQNNGYEADQNIVESCEIDGYYGGFLNTGDTGDRTRIRDIKIQNIGAGTVFSGMKTAVSKIVRLENIQGFETKEVYSSDFAVDSVASVNVVIPHGLAYTPSMSRIQSHIGVNTAVNDWDLGFIRVQSVDATNITVRVKVTNASATGGALATLYVSVDTQADEGFDLQSIT
jgi:hypothetical protein